MIEVNYSRSFFSENWFAFKQEASFAIRSGFRQFNTGDIVLIITEIFEERTVVIEDINADAQPYSLTCAVS